nr:septal ring lytic transglycosylase RlpA family protein [uncultured Sphingorhabdus sp.]
MVLAACASVGGYDQGSTSQAASQAASQYNQVRDEPVTLGAPFKVGAVSYAPQDIPAYDDVGYASYQGAEAGARQTANGEAFNPAGATAAHKTLPMPSYVEVTALDTGRTIVVRINDRGPFANDRLIDLSEGAARQLGIFGQPYAGVRVRRVNPPEQERAVLRDGMTAAERIETPETLLKVLRDKLAKLPRPAGASRSAAPMSTVRSSGPSYATSTDGRFIREGGAQAAQAKGVPFDDASEAEPYIVQIAAFSSRGRADAFARKMGASVSSSGNSSVYRVYFGPYANEAAAQQGLLRSRKAGNAEARIARR